MSDTMALEATVDDDGSLAFEPGELSAHGLAPGDRVRVIRTGPRPIRSMLGIHNRGTNFSQDHLHGLRREMGAGAGEDLRQ